MTKQKSEEYLTQENHTVNTDTIRRKFNGKGCKYLVAKIKGVLSRKDRTECLNFTRKMEVGTYQLLDKWWHFIPTASASYKRSMLH